MNWEPGGSFPFITVVGAMTDYAVIFVIGCCRCGMSYPCHWHCVIMLLIIAYFIQFKYFSFQSIAFTLIFLLSSQLLVFFLSKVVWKRLSFSDKAGYNYTANFFVCIDLYISIKFYVEHYSICYSRNSIE